MHSAAMREMSEPRDGIRPTPVTFLILCFFFTMWGGYYIGAYGGDWTGTGMNEKAGAAAPVASAPQNPMALGAEVYNACTQCHQADGKGLAGQFPPLAASEYVTGDERRFAAILLNGINGDFVVNGQKYNSQMPAWKDNYNDEEIAAVMTYVRNSFGNKAAPVSKQVVEAVRKEVGANGPWSESSLAEFAAKK
ncbi:MAG: cytochrome c [Acidobacteria bacterium]|nr:cytochrome c [Acidobacteriota bacterium]